MTTGTCTACLLKAMHGSRGGQDGIATTGNSITVAMATTGYHVNRTVELIGTYSNMYQYYMSTGGRTGFSVRLKYQNDKSQLDPQWYKLVILQQYCQQVRYYSTRPCSSYLLWYKLCLLMFCSRNSNVFWQ